MKNPVVPVKAKLPLLIEASDYSPKSPYNITKDGVRQYGLSPAEWLFVQEYLSTRSHIEAYMKAYNCTRASATSGGRKLLQRPDIAQVIYDLMAELGRAMVADRNAVRALLWREAVDPANKGSERIKAIELMSKIDKFVDEKDAKGKGGNAPVVNVNISNGEAKITATDGEGSEQVLTIEQPRVTVKMPVLVDAPTRAEEVLEEEIDL